jgi:hypothetical protein
MYGTYLGVSGCLPSKGCIRLLGNPDEEYDLDNPMDRNKLGIAHNDKHADGYCHFPECTWMVQESKGKGNLQAALTQLENTVQQLLKSGWKVTLTVVVVEKISRLEHRLFHVDPKTHELRMKESTRGGVRIPGVQTPVKVILKKDLPRVVGEAKLSGWVSVSH